MKIVLISAANNIHTVRWANGLLEKGNEVFVISCSNHKESYNKFSSAVQLIYLKFKSGLGYYLNSHQLKKYIKKIKPDIVNVHYASGYGTLARVTKISGYLLNVWGSDIYDFPNKNIINKIVLKKNLKYAYAIASTSNCMAKETLKYIKKPIFITPFGVDTKKFFPLNVKKDKVIIGTVKTLEPVYGIDVLIYAIKELVDRGYKNFEYHIYGKGNKKNDYEKIVHDLKLEQYVLFKGYCPNNQLNEVINGFTISIFGSLSESFGVAAVESMACGIPVIATNVDGFREVLDDNFDGYLYEPKDYVKLADLIVSLAFNKKNYDVFSINSRKKIEEVYDWGKNVDNMISIYNKLQKGDLYKND